MSNEETMSIDERCKCLRRCRSSIRRRRARSVASYRTFDAATIDEPITLGGVVNQRDDTISLTSSFATVVIHVVVSEDHQINVCHAIVLQIGHDFVSSS